MTIPRDSTATRPTAGAVIAGGGGMGELMRNFDWSRTPVGAPDTWPQSLRTAISILLESRFPKYIAWGPEFVEFYNDAFRPILGTKHPTLGGTSRDTWAEIWPDFVGRCSRKCGTPGNQPSVSASSTAGGRGSPPASAGTSAALPLRLRRGRMS